MTTLGRWTLDAGRWAERKNDGCRRMTTLGLDAGQRERTTVAEE